MQLNFLGNVRRVFQIPFIVDSSRFVGRPSIVKRRSNIQYSAVYAGQDGKGSLKFRKPVSTAFAGHCIGVTKEMNAQEAGGKEQKGCSLIGPTFLTPLCRLSVRSPRLVLVYDSQLE